MDDTFTASDTWIIVSTVVQALSAVFIAGLTWRIVRFTRKHVQEAERVSGLAALSQVLDGLPFPVIASPMGDEHGVTGFWKNVERGPALNIELAIEALGGGGNVSFTMDVYSHAIQAMQADAAETVAALFRGETNG